MGGHGLRLSRDFELTASLRLVRVPHKDRPQQHLAGNITFATQITKHGRHICTTSSGHRHAQAPPTTRTTVTARTTTTKQPQRPHQPPQPPQQQPPVSWPIAERCCRRGFQVSDLSDFGDRVLAHHGSDGPQRNRVRFSMGSPRNSYHLSRRQQVRKLPSSAMGRY